VLGRNRQVYVKYISGMYLVHAERKPVFSYHYFCTMCLKPSAKTLRSTGEERRCRRAPLLTGLRL